MSRKYYRGARHTNKGGGSRLKLVNLKLKYSGLMSIPHVPCKYEVLLAERISCCVLVIDLVADASVSI